uniref:Uncharacterized protein n=1 Tax=Cacopsylla melanoneura TaxID=428564 RepID=A0A8D8R083_9HEMI
MLNTKTNFQKKTSRLPTTLGSLNPGMSSMMHEGSDENDENMDEFDDSDLEEILPFLFKEDFLTNYELLRTNEIIKKTRLLGLEKLNDMASNTKCGYNFKQNNLSVETASSVSVCLMCKTQECPKDGMSTLVLNGLCSEHWKTIMNVFRISEMPYYYLDGDTTNGDEAQRQYGQTQPGQTKMIFTHLASNPRPYFPMIGLLALYTVSIGKGMEYLRSLWLNLFKNFPTYRPSIMAVFDFIYDDADPSLQAVRNKWVSEALQNLGSYSKKITKFVYNTEPSIHDDHTNVDEKRTKKLYRLGDLGVSVFELFLLATFDKSDIAMNNNTKRESSSLIYMHTIGDSHESQTRNQQEKTQTFNAMYVLDGPIPIAPVMSELLRTPVTPQFINCIPARILCEVPATEPAALQSYSCLGNSFNMVLAFNATPDHSQSKIQKVFGD